MMNDKKRKDEKTRKILKNCVISGVAGFLVPLVAIFLAGWILGEMGLIVVI